MRCIGLPCREVISNAHRRCADTMPSALFQAGEETGGDEGPAWSDETAEGIDAWPGERDRGP